MISLKTLTRIVRQRTDFGKYAWWHIRVIIAHWKEREAHIYIEAALALVPGAQRLYQQAAGGDQQTR
jgi:hypothetical protein